MAVGAVQYGYVNMEYSYSSKEEVQKTAWENEMISSKEKSRDEESEILGIGSLDAGNNLSYGMVARYAENSTEDNPIIKVSVCKGEGKTEEYYININEVNPTNATEIEMFALCNYADSIGKGTGSTFGSWNTLSYYRYNANHLGIFEMSNTMEQFTTLKQNWTSMVGAVLEVYIEAGIFKQAMDGNKLLGIFSEYNLDTSEENSIVSENEGIEEIDFERFAPNAPDEVKQAFMEAATETGYDETGKMNHISQILVRQVENRHNGVANPNDIFGNTVETALEAAKQLLYDLENPLTPIGQRGKNAIRYIEQEKEFYRKFIEKLESIEEAIREIMKEEQERRESEQSQKEQSGVIDDASSLLTADSTSCVYPTADPEDDDLRYITWYTEEGIFCRKAGQTEGYEWSIVFENKEQYDKVMEFIGQFPSDWNMRFAAHENFWNDFLNDEIDMDGFMEFINGTNKGVPDFSITVGNSVYVDKEKAQWAKYTNPLNARFYTAEEMHQMQTT